jgi:hypothetical protein
MSLKEEKDCFLKVFRPKPIPEFLYKYSSASTQGLEKIFQQREIYFNGLNTFNDPFECKRVLISHKNEFKRDLYFKELTRDSFPNLDKKAFKKIKKDAIRKTTNPDLLKQFYDNVISNIGIYCLSEKKNDLLMWAHYSDSHQGVCLEFKTMKNSLFAQAFPVIYQEDYPKVNIMDLENPEEFRKALLTKSSEWSYEMEWRILMMEQDGGLGYYPFLPELLSGVIFGIRISNENKEKVKTWIEKYPTKISIYQAKLNDRKYLLDIVKIDEV